MKHFKILLISVCILFSACAPFQRVIVDKDALKSRSTYNIKLKHHFVFVGIGQEKTLQAKEYCDDINLKLGYVDFVHNYWMELFTAGIYSPRKIVIHCFNKKTS